MEREDESKEERTKEKKNKIMVKKFSWSVLAP